MIYTNLQNILKRNIAIDKYFTERLRLSCGNCKRKIKCKGHLREDTPGGQKSDKFYIAEVLIPKHKCKIYHKNEWGYVAQTFDIGIRPSEVHDLSHIFAPYNNKGQIMVPTWTWKPRIRK